MFGDHFYHATVRRFVAVFGTLFNDISIIRKDSTGAVKSIIRVPLAYGPKEKFLARMDEEPDLSIRSAIKLPRMSFEILNISYDTQSKLNRNNKIQIGDKLYYTFAPYNISINLSIIAKNQDDALQIIEQIIPYFQPEYTVTIKEGVSDTLKTDIPITLSTIDMQEDYEGDFMSRRAIIYTLSFDAKVRFYGPERNSKQIKTVIVNTFDTDNVLKGYEQQTNSINPTQSKSSEEYTIIQEINFLDDPKRAVINLQSYEYGGNGQTYVLVEQVIGTTSGAIGVVQEYTVGSQLVIAVTSDINFIPNELVVGSISGAQWVSKDFTLAKGY